MNRSLTTHVVITALLLPTASPAERPDATAAPEGVSSGKSRDLADIQRVMDSFHQAVVTHDGSKLGALFIPEGSTWLNVLTDEAYARVKSQSPATPRVRIGSYKEFATFVSNSKATLDPRHSHLRIQSDGTIASVYFDFVFLIDGKVENRGCETWQLVKGPGGWQIAALTYSSDPHPG
jgi:hypothetical protein